MDILVLGGTRFVGRTTAKLLVGQGHAVTVASRRRENVPTGATCVIGERPALVAELRGRRFDIVLDFIAYDETAPQHLLSAVPSGLYVLISSTWVPRLGSNKSAIELLETSPSSAPPGMQDITYRYLVGKVRAESAVVAQSAHSTEQRVILRLPIMWGAGDRTGRLGFYRQRIHDGGPVIAVSGGRNAAQIAWSEDIARALIGWLVSREIASAPVWEALPDEGRPVRELLAAVARAEGRPIRLADVPESTLERRLPGYLLEEPLWRECPLDRTSRNLFRTAGVVPTACDTWLQDLVREPARPASTDLRQVELTLLRELGHA
jgi:nucleoside-diphosphate-sugar epimerase